MNENENNNQLTPAAAIAQLQEELRAMREETARQMNERDEVIAQLMNGGKDTDVERHYTTGNQIADSAAKIAEKLNKRR